MHENTIMGLLVGSHMIMLLPWSLGLDKWNDKLLE